VRPTALGFIVCALLACTACSNASAPAESTSAPRKPKPSVKKAAKPNAAPSKTAASTAPTTPENYTYQTGGRRDPFTNLIGTGTSSEPRAPMQRGEGLAGMMVNELTVRGVMQSRGAFLAMVQGPDKKTYVVHAGDKFMDGSVKSVNAQGLVIVQNVNDPLSIEKQREVRKLLHSLEDAKP
jgi:Tfp pilus assembly protein PilP